MPFKGFGCLAEIVAGWVLLVQFKVLFGVVNSHLSGGVEVWFYRNLIRKRYILVGMTILAGRFHIVQI